MLRVQEKYIGLLLLCLLSLSIALLMGELFVRWLAPQKLVREYTIPDAELGIILKPNQETFDNYTPQYYTYDVRTNSYGLRMDDEIDISKNKILLLGDSFTFGWGVEIDKSYAQIVKKNIENMCHNIQFVNAGVGSYSTGHVLKVLKRFNSIMDIVGVIYFMNSNDLYDNINTNINYQVVSFKQTSSGKIELSDKKVYTSIKRFLLTNVPIYVRLNQKSHLFLFIKSVFNKTTRNTEFRPMVRTKTTSTENEFMVHAVSLAHLDRLSQYTIRNALPLLIVWIPDFCELSGERISFYERFKDSVLNLASMKKIVFYDPTDNLKTLIHGSKVEQIYFPDGHFNDLGNSYYANSIDGTITDFIRAHMKCE